MSQPAIEVTALSKRYVIQHESRHDNLRDTLHHTARKLWRKVRWGTGFEREEFWALRNVSFSVQPGEVIGIIGRNGAGKSTLLKILSRITEPTAGSIRLRGRVASLLEVGTGFHPDLTGRENIFLNGAILGMRRAEIRAKFDEIVAFAEIERFLDTPVKRYSSGMYVRLAFAVAAHLEPEILIVDEVLAVGDVAFQKKCLGKMQDVSQGQGRTVLIVSHQMSTIRRLCTRAVLLEQGRLSAIGPTEQIVPIYFGSSIKQAAVVDLLALPEEKRRGNGKARFSSIDIKTTDNQPAVELRIGEPFQVTLEIEAQVPLSNVVFGFSFIANDGTEVQGTVASDSELEFANLEEGRQHFTCMVEPMRLCPGRYFIRGAIFRGEELFDHVDEMLAFEVTRVPFAGAATPAGHIVGYIYQHFKWKRTS